MGGGQGFERGERYLKQRLELEVGSVPNKEMNLTWREGLSPGASDPYS